MYQIIKLIIALLLLFSCSKKEEIRVVETDKTKSLEIYRTAIKAMNKGDMFFASKQFTESELLFDEVSYSAKAAILSSYCLYRINFYDESLEALKLYQEKYPVDKNIPYAYYLSAIISYEQILDEKHDLAPLLESKKKMEDYIIRFPDNEYSMDLKFKLDLVENQMAAKELYIAKFYIKTQKWIPAINRLKIIVEKYDKTVFIEEALHRLVETYYKIGLVKEAKKAASILGYNYNSSEWYERSYAVLNKDYKKIRKKKLAVEKSEGLLRRTIKKIMKQDVK
jgi:outer membrane protein assembly factor BamD|tara:strand:+ start:45 stop:887 length:843 start_codon:yes stop_codon:yes gene_type:complete